MGVSNLTQNVHTGRPPNALPSSTHSYYSTALYSRIFPPYRTAVHTLCKLQRASVDGAIDRCWLFAHSDLVDQFQRFSCIHRIPHFSMKAEPKFLTGILLIAGRAGMRILTVLVETTRVRLPPTNSSCIM